MAMNYFNIVSVDDIVRYTAWSILTLYLDYMVYLDPESATFQHHIIPQSEAHDPAA